MYIGFISVKIIFGLALLFAITKFLGKTQISQITPFDFISSIVMGELFVHSVFEEPSNLIHMAYPIVLWGVLVYLIERIAQKNRKLRGFFEGSPSVVIRDGRIDVRELRRNKTNLDQLLNLLRMQGAFSLSEVKYAILEMNGTLSVLKNSSDAAPTRGDLNLPPNEVSLPVVLISDGRVLEENLRATGLDRNWLEDQMRKQMIPDLHSVFYAEWLPQRGLTVSLR